MERGDESRIDTPPVGWPTAALGDLVVDLLDDAGLPQAIEDLLGIGGVDAVPQALTSHLLARHFSEAELADPAHDATRLAVAFAGRRAMEQGEGVRSEVVRPQAHGALD